MKKLSERDICTKYITPSLISAGWDLHNQIREEEFKKMGVDVVIYANHLLRSSYPAMEKVMKKILDNERSFECDEDCLPIKSILNLITAFCIFI